MLQLFASQEHEGSARVPIRWCVGRDLLGRFSKEQVLHPYLLILVNHAGYGWNEVDRKLVPLDQLMEYFDFHRPGEHKIQAMVVWQKDGDVRKLKAALLGGWYKTASYSPARIRDHEGNLCVTIDPDIRKSGIQFAETGELMVSVDQSFFAKEPSEFEKWWVNLWFGRKQKDQCQFKKRRILAYTIQPLAVAVYLLFLFLVRFLCAAFFVSICHRGINFSPLVHPWIMDTNDIWYEARREGKGTLFTRRKNGESATDLGVPLAPLAPIATVVIFIGILFTNFFVKDLGVTLLGAFGYALAGQVIIALAWAFLWGSAYFIFEVLPKKTEHHLKGFWTQHRTLGNTAIIFGLLTLVVAVTALEVSRGDFVLLYIFSSFGALILLGWGLVKIEKILTEREEKLNRAAFSGATDEHFDREALELYDALTCTGSALRADLSALPKRNRTFYLRFQELKTKLCKPYAQ